MTATDTRRTAGDLSALADFGIEVPSWAYGNSGTRFKVFATAGVPRDPYEKIEDAAQVHRVTGAAPRVSLHIPWDRVDDFGKLAAFAADQGVSLGAINSNVFQDDDYKLGSLTNADPKIRAKAVAHHIECIDVMRATGSKDLKLWLPDGTNYAGQDSIRARQDRLADSLQKIYAELDDDHRLLIEYKFFEPYFYTTDIPDWGTSLLHCLALGEKAQVVLDTGHHAPGTNIEFIVAQLIRQGRLGAVVECPPPADRRVAGRGTRDMRVVAGRGERRPDDRGVAGLPVRARCRRAFLSAPSYRRRKWPGAPRPTGWTLGIARYASAGVIRPVARCGRRKRSTLPWVYGWPGAPCFWWMPM